jgi:hypothetical protein
MFIVYVRVDAHRSHGVPPACEHTISSIFAIVAAAVEACATADVGAHGRALDLMPLQYRSDTTSSCWSRSTYFCIFLQTPSLVFERKKMTITSNLQTVKVVLKKLCNTLVERGYVPYKHDRDLRYAARLVYGCMRTYRCCSSDMDAAASKRIHWHLVDIHTILQSSPEELRPQSEPLREFVEACVCTLRARYLDTPSAAPTAARVEDNAREQDRAGHA